MMIAAVREAIERLDRIDRGLSARTVYGGNRLNGWTEDARLVLSHYLKQQRKHGSH